MSNIPDAIVGPPTSSPVPRADLVAPDVRESTAIAALISDPTRATILVMLRGGPHCVCELASVTGERENNVSNHLSKLREAGLVRASRHAVNGRFLYYELDESAIIAARAALDDIL